MMTIQKKNTGGKHKMRKVNVINILNSIKTTIYNTNVEGFDTIPCRLDRITLCRASKTSCLKHDRHGL